MHFFAMKMKIFFFFLNTLFFQKPSGILKSIHIDRNKNIELFNSRQKNDCPE